MDNLNNNHQPIDTETILVVDDDEYIRNLLQVAISHWGYQVIEAKDGEEASLIMQQPNAPQILILDWLMPKLDGIELCKRIRSSGISSPYIIFLTQMSGAENILKGVEAGADEFLLKPINFPELRHRIFTGERITKYRKMIEDQKKQLAMNLLYIKTLEAVIKMTLEKKRE